MPAFALPPLPRQEPDAIRREPENIARAVGVFDRRAVAARRHSAELRPRLAAASTSARRPLPLRLHDCGEGA